MNSDIKLPEIMEEEFEANWKPGSEFWTLLTGHSKIFSKHDLNYFLNNNPLLWFLFPEKLKKKIKFPESEIKPIKDIKIQGFKTSEWLHISWMGFNDSLRTYVFDQEGLKELKTRISALNIEYTNLPNDMGFYIQTKIPAIVKDTGTKTTDSKKFKKGHIDGYVFFLTQDKIKTPLDLLFFADSIAKLHPETAKNLITQMIGKITIARQQSEVWKQALHDSENLEIPDELINTKNEVLEYIENIDEELKNFLNQLFQRLNPEDSEKEKQKMQEIQKEVSQSSLLFKEQTKKRNISNN